MFTLKIKATDPFSKVAFYSAHWTSKKEKKNTLAPKNTSRNTSSEMKFASEHTYDHYEQLPSLTLNLISSFPVLAMYYSCPFFF